ncbi:uncharacterized protein LOC129789232 [Lutzomyia longipalpis]|uniref:uncharacterized protein LOC129789232 n=1 Tax=Lutzomyia longipalpis TaxID=7200 RepID=UPI002484570B|nr:uncharacterized protein LOC129789232 [Lutzomyia longipalpis]
MSNVKSRSAYKGQLTSVKGVIAQYQSEEMLKRHGARIHLERQLEQCDRIRVNYNKVQDVIINAAENDDDREREIEEQNAFLRDIDDAETAINQLITEVMMHCSSFESTRVDEDQIGQLLRGFSELLNKAHEGSNSQYSRLEPVKVPTFSGAYAEWHSFRDLFVSLVDANPRLTDTQKLHYLKTSLAGQAKGVIDHLMLTGENYAIAWNALCNRFENRRTVIKEHIERVKKLPAAKTPRADELRKIYDVTTTTLAAIDALQAFGRDPWIIHEVLSKMDTETQTLWAREQTDMPTWDEFQSLTISQDSKSQDSCTVCKKASHKLWKCGHFKSMPALKRLETVNNLNLCSNCISESRSRHPIDKCPYPPCKHCGQMHNYWLHDALTQSQSELPKDAPNPVLEETARPVVCSGVVPLANQNNVEGHRAILKTACVKILDSQSNVHICRALLDFGSEISVMTTDLCQRLRLNLSKSPYGQVEGFQGQVSNIKHQVKATLVPRNGSNISVLCQVTPKISSNLPTCRINPKDVRIPENFVLADPTWHQTGRIDLLIGAAHEDEIMLDDVYKLGEGKPSLRNTVFGWTIGGKWQPANPLSQQSTAVCHTISLKTIDDTLEKFWKLEELPEESPQSVEQKEVEATYQSTTRRSETGQYIVQLPLKGNFGELGSNRSRAARQLNFLERRLSRNPQLYDEYSNIFEEYLRLGIIERVPIYELKSKSYYMTHHCVVREDALSTKVRIVFNCGSVSETGKSLNDFIKVGPVVQPELIIILWRFRQNEIALSCDIVKMYLQVLLEKLFKDLQRFLWRKSPGEPMIDYRFKTLCFGNAASPYLATKTLIRLAEDEGENFPRAAEVLRKHCYVDDCLLSVKSVEEALQVQKELISLLSKAQMQLSKWQSNSQEVLKAVAPVSNSPTEISNPEKSVKALGMMWNPASDTFFFNVDPTVDTLKPTKRNILSIIARIYDPLGLLAPITVKGKMLLQNLWKDQSDWDSEMKGDNLRDWMKFLEAIHTIPQIKIPRWTSSFAEPLEEQLHMFSDASNLAYGAAIYRVTIDASGKIVSHLLTAKSKVTPVKKKTIPKLELTAATLGAQLVEKVSKSLGITKVYCWVDAKVVLAQIASASNKQDIFTKNRRT